MQPLEIALVLLLVAAVAWRLGGPRAHRGHRLLAMAAVVVATAHVVTGDHRWQMLVPYALTVVLAVVAWIPDRDIHRPRTRVAGWIAAGVLATGFPVLLPVPSLPAPDGPYAVGTTTIVAVDDTRVEVYGPEPGGPRSLPIHIWYPAEPTGRNAPGWLTADATAAMSNAYGLPRFFLSHLALTETHAVRDAPVVAGAERFPVVIYSHGWGGFGRISPDQPERLASHGYVVIAPDHTYGAQIAEFPDGIVSLDPMALPDEEEIGEDEFAVAADRLVATYAADLEFVFGLVAEGDVTALGLNGRMDVRTIGVYGHSTGGGAAVAACYADERCDAVLGLDPWVIPVDPYAIAEGLDQPFLAIRSDRWVGDENDEVLFDLHAAASASSTILALEGANHYDFVALSQVSPLARYLGFTGSIPAPIARDAIGGTLVAFFDRTLKGRDTAFPSWGRLRLDAER